uniref:non-specific serine/threonine protein kinase n=1 Tax=Steinernema glaseri TaxID=37863 RepID=A0A1I7YQZ6_9BILA
MSIQTASVRVSCATFSSMDKYILQKKLGEGTFAVVYKAEHRRTKEIFAVKCIKKQWTENGILQCVLREISLLRQLNHPNIVQLKEVIATQMDTALVFEYLSSDLGTYLRQKQMKESHIKTFCYQIVLAVRFLHQCGVIHRDLKPANILVGNNGILKVADLGSAKELHMPIREDYPKVVTLLYRAPELLLGAICHSTPIDVWSIGCILAEMVLKKPFFCWDVNNKQFAEHEQNQLAAIFRILERPTEETWPEVSKLPYFDDMHDVFHQRYTYSFNESMEGKMSIGGLGLLEKMLIFCPDRRITCNHIVSHPYFANVDEAITDC